MPLQRTVERLTPERVVTPVDETPPAGCAPHSSRPAQRVAEAEPGPAPALEDTHGTLRQLAAELHDGVLQDLFAARLELDEALSQPVAEPQARALVAAARRMSEGSERVRALLKSLDTEHQPPPASSRPLLQELHDCLARTRRRGELTLAIDITGTGPEPAGAGRALLVRLARESLANVLKHAQATQATLHLARGNTWWTIELDDDGTGDPIVLRNHINARCGTASYGLRSLADEAGAAGGRVWACCSDRLGGITLGAAIPIHLAER